MTLCEHHAMTDQTASGEEEKSRKESDLQLMPSLPDLSKIPKEGKALIIVAEVNGVLHFRIFNDANECIVDTDEKKLKGKEQQLKALREQLQCLWPPPELAARAPADVIADVKAMVIANVTALVDPIPIKGQVRIIVLGDLSLDTLVAPLPNDEKSSDSDPSTRKDGKLVAWNESDKHCLRIERKGGAWLLCEIINEALQFKDLHLPHVVTYNLPSASVAESLYSHYMNSFAILGLFPKEAPKPGEAKHADKERVYRLKEVLGWVHTVPLIEDGKKKAEDDKLKGELVQLADKLDSKKPADILVLHDRDGHFRQLEENILEGYLTKYLAVPSKKEEDARGWIVWQMYSELTKGNLWKVISKKKDWLDRTVAVVKVDCLRQAGANLSEGISLERESRNFLKSLRQDGLKDLARVRHLIVHFHRQGVLHFDRDSGLTNSCYFCPSIAEDPYQDKEKRGTMAGYTSILVAAIVRGMAWSMERNKGFEADRRVALGIVDGVKQGVVLDHWHHRNGYAPSQLNGQSGEQKPYATLFRQIDAAAVRQWKGKEYKPYRIAALELPEDSDVLSFWTRIEGLIQSRRKEWKEKGKTTSEKGKTTSEVAEEVAFDVVRLGLEKVVEKPSDTNEVADPRSRPVPTPGTPPGIIRCPTEVHGKLKTVDRREIDSFSSIRRLMQKYLASRDWKRRPLSLAVFGPPGSGKSFTIKQLLDDIDPDSAKRSLDFNVAQFTDLEDLKNAFHKAQDRALEGEVPLVVFDEFDSDFKGKLGWLKYFLAPMQDGKFKAGESMYRIGQAIFVFTGGIYKSFSEFYDLQKDLDDFKNAKGPDFVSRLRGHLDIAGINPPLGKIAQAASAESNGVPGQPSIDAVLMFRRAVLLRSFLEQSLKEIIDPITEEARIEIPVIRAFLRVPEYKHGARSMEAIIEMARVSHRGRFLRSSLPSEEQLNMHVDAKEFLKLVDDPTPSGAGKAEPVLADGE
jgi:hypothetical protein